MDIVNKYIETTKDAYKLLNTSFDIIENTIKQLEELKNIAREDFSINEFSKAYDLLTNDEYINSVKFRKEIITLKLNNI